MTSKRQLDAMYHDRVRERQARDRGFCRAGIMFCLAILSLGVLGCVAANAAMTGGVLGASMFAPIPVLRDEEPEPGGGGGGEMSQKQFQSEMLASAKSAKGQIDQLTENYEQLHKSTKAEFEKLTKMKNDHDGLDSSVKSLELQIKKLGATLKQEQKMAFGDPLSRIVKDEEKRLQLGAMIFKAIRPHDKMPEKYEKALTSGASPGSTMVDDELHGDVYDLLSTYGVWNTFDVRNVNVTTNKFLVKTARPIALAFGEGVAITEDTNKAGTSVTQTVKGIKVLLGVANELLEDAEIDGGLQADILRDFAEAVAYRMDYFCLQADGTNDGANGAQTGIFEGGTAVTAAAGNTTMETLDFEDVTAVLTGSPEPLLSRNSAWWLHPSMLVRFLHIKDNNGRPIFLTATEAPTAGGIGSLLGYRTILSPAAPNTNSAGNKVAAFGDPNALVCGLRKRFEFKSSTEANFNEDETIFRGIARFGCKVRAATGFSLLKLAAS